MKFDASHSETYLVIILLCKITLTESFVYNRQGLGITDLTTEPAIPVGTTQVFYSNNDITRIPFGFFNVSTITGKSQFVHFFIINTQTIFFVYQV